MPIYKVSNSQLLVEPFTSNEQTRYELNGVRVGLTWDTGKHLEAIASDGKMLVRVVSPLRGLRKNKLTESGIILDSKGVKDLRKLLSKSKQQIVQITDVESGDARVKIPGRKEDYSISVIAKGSRFPNYPAVLPKDTDVATTLPAYDVIRICKDLKEHLKEVEGDVEKDPVFIGVKGMPRTINQRTLEIRIPENGLLFFTQKYKLEDTRKAFHLTADGIKEVDLIVTRNMLWLTAANMDYLRKIARAYVRFQKIHGIEKDEAAMDFYLPALRSRRGQKKVTDLWRHSPLEFRISAGDEEMQAVLMPMALAYPGEF